MMATMKAGFISQGKEGIVKARAVEDQLMRDTWEVAGYDLLPKAREPAHPDPCYCRRLRLHGRGR